MEKRISFFLVRNRFILSIFSLLLTLLLAFGIKNFYVNNNYNIFFDLDDPQVIEHELHQAIFTKTDNVVFFVHAKDGDIFTSSKLNVIEQMTEKAWQTPFAIRVDSLTNFQNSWAEGDELVVEDLVLDSIALSEIALLEIKNIALSEKQLLNRIISNDGATTLINVSLEIPEYPDDLMPHQERVEALKKRDQATAEIVNYVRQLKDEISANSNQVTVHLSGDVVINQNLTESSGRDVITLIPLMFFAIVIILAILLRSVGSIVGAAAVVILSVVAAIGGLGWLGYSFNAVIAVAPIVILTIAVCDCIHLLSVYLLNLSLGQSRIDAMRNSLEVNLHPIFITSLTTAVGFLTLNFSESPPFQDLGNICALGVLYAMLLTLVLLPSISMALIGKKTQKSRHNQVTRAFAEFIISHRKPVFFITLIISVSLMSLIPLNKVNDDASLYFQVGNEYRDAVDFSQKTLPGVYDINFSLSCGAENCIHEPAFLGKAAAFENWLLRQSGVESVVSYVDVIKRISRNLNGDDKQYYKLPDNKVLSAQYNLLYELSLPYGLDLNNLINFNKSSLRISVFASQMTTGEFVELEAVARQWLDDNYPGMGSQGSSVRMMFASLGEKNIYAMMWGALFALLGATFTILLSLRSVKYAFISFVPNSFPAAIAFGVWGATIAQVNMGVAAVFSITLGIIIDDSVHFISKYRRAREVGGLSAEDAIYYAFETVAPALAITTAVLAIGFSLLCFSDFNMNAYLGALTALTVVIALIFDFLMLPPLLLFFDSLQNKKKGLVRRN